jgi:transcriptional regulator NrdR family protein
MTCPACHAHNTYISYTHPGDGERVKRDRRCAECGHRFETVEVLASALRVLTFQASMLKVINGNGKE